MCSHFFKGIGKEIVPILGDIAGAALTAFGMPEFGIPLAAAVSGGSEALGGGKIGQDLLAAAGGGLAGALPLAGPALGGVLGLGSTVGDTLVGAAGGALSGAATGNPLAGALTGGAGGLAAGLSGVGDAAGTTGGMGGGATPSVGAGVTGTGAGASAMAAPAAAGVPDVGSGFIGSPELGGQIASGLPSVGGASSTASAFPILSSGGYFDTTTGPAAEASASGGASVPAGTNLPASDVSNLPATAAGNITTGGGSSGGLGGFINNLFGGGSSSGSSGEGSFETLFGSGTTSGGSGGSSSGIASLLKDIAPIASLGGVGLSAMRSLNGPLSNPNQYASSLAGAPATLSSSIAPQVAALTGQAKNMSNQGQTLASYLSSGQLPPGVQQSIDQAAAAAKAQIRSQYGGQNTSAMQEDLANVDRMAATQGSQIAMNLLQTGINEQQSAANITSGLINTGITEAELSTQIYEKLLQSATAQNAALGQSIGNFASALAGQPTILRAA